MTALTAAAGTRASGLGYRPALDGLRGLAVTAVMLTHSGLSFAEGGGVGVHVFFALSGFLITTLLFEEWSAGGGTIRLAYFWARRGLRLVPALILVLAAVLVYSATLAPEAVARSSYRAVPAVLTYVSNWVQALGNHDLGMLGHTWSLAVEEQFYIVWPLVLVGVLAYARSRVLRALGALSLAIGTMALLLRVLTWRGIGGASRLFGTDMVADQLIGGALLAALVTFGSVAGNERLRRISRWAWAPAAGYLLLVVFGLRTSTGSWALTGYATVGLTATAVSSVLLIANVVTWPEALPSRALAWPPLVALGRISYGVYLWQLPVFFVVVIHMGSASVWLRAAIGIVASITLATLSWFSVERWALRLKDRFRAHPRRESP